MFYALVHIKQTSFKSIVVTTDINFLQKLITKSESGAADDDIKASFLPEIEHISLVNSSTSSSNSGFSTAAKICIYIYMCTKNLLYIKGYG